MGNSRSIQKFEDPDYITIPCEIGDPKVAQLLMQTAMDRFCRVDTLINNAGIWRPAQITEIPEERFRRKMATNLDSVFFTTQAAVKAMEQREGANAGRHIIHVGTSLVEHALSNLHAVLSPMSEGAVVAATRGLAMELTSRNIRVNAVSLGIIRTPLHEPESLEGKKSFAPLNP